MSLTNTRRDFLKLGALTGLSYILEKTGFAHALTGRRFAHSEVMEEEKTIRQEPPR